MNYRIIIPLLIGLIMFPQIVETMYSPILVDIAQSFDVTAAVAGQTLSVYFIAFAAGTLVWGYLCDKIGRRRSMIYALIIYIIATSIALFVTQFELLLAMRVLSAFSAAIGSIGTQTILRDCFKGNKLSAIFSIMGIALAISPIIGLISGSYLGIHGGFKSVFMGLIVIAILLFFAVLFLLPETRRDSNATATIKILITILLDPFIIICGVMVALFNIMLFSYYQLGPFIFSQLGLTMSQFGYSGIALGVGVLLGALINHRLITYYHCQPIILIILAAAISTISAALIVLMNTMINTIMGNYFNYYIGFIVLIGVIMLAYSIAIPNILSVALRRYQSYLGLAGAIFGCLYYSLIGLGLVVVSLGQNLSITLLLLSLGAIIISLSFKRYF